MSGKNEFLREKPVDVRDEQIKSLFFKIVTLALIFLGIWASTQRFASLVNYEPGWCDTPFYYLVIRGVRYPLYSPFNIFIWFVKYWRYPEIHPYIYRAMWIAGIVSGVAIVFYFAMDFFLIKRGDQGIFGTARWANDKDLEKAGVLGDKGGMILGQISKAQLSYKYDMEKQSVVLHLKQPARKVIQSGVYNTALSAPTRSGKGVSSVIPTCVSYPGSMIILDFKGENFNLTSGFRSRFGKIYRWAPTGEVGHHFNPMMEIRPGDDAFSDANLLADILTTPASGGDSGSANSDHFIPSGV
jgi:type IV secretion system protein VirD4